MINYRKITVEEVEDMVVTRQDCKIACCASKMDVTKNARIFNAHTFRKSLTYFRRFHRSQKLKECDSLRGRVLKYYIIEED